MTHQHKRLEESSRLATEMGRVDVEPTDGSRSAELDDTPIVSRIVPPTFPATV